MEDIDTNRTNLTCQDSIRAITDPLAPYETLSLLVPINDTVWTDRSEIWMIFFIIIISIFALIYFCIGLTSVVLMIRKDSLRTPTKTFFAVYLTMIILGFSRAAFFILDPFGVLGFISKAFPAWIIISRYLASVGFPSLVGACTLIVMTLVKLAQSTDLRKQWYEYWKYVLILIAIPYAIALLAESLGHITQYTALLSGLACELVFVLWGLSICVFYLVAGKNLLVKLQAAHRRATMLSESTSTTNTIQQTAGESSCYFGRHHNKAKRIKRKIVKITFGTAIAGIFYSFVSAGGVIMILLLIFYDCMGRDQESRTNSDWWLAVQFFNYIAEIILAFFVLYSITDVSKFAEFVQCILSCCYCCFSGNSVSSGNGGVEVQRDPETVSTSESARNSGNLGEEEAGIERVQNCNETDTAQAQNGCVADRQFKINVNDPDGSIESGESPSATDRSSQGHKRVKKTSVVQLEQTTSYNSISETNLDERPLELVGQIFSVTDSPTFGRSYQSPLKFFRRTPSRELTPAEEHKPAIHPESRKLKHFASSPVPASPRVQEKHSESPSHPVTPFPSHITSPITPNSPQSPYSQKPTETQRLLSKHESASKLSRKGTV